MSLEHELPISRRRFVTATAALAAGPLLVTPTGAYAQIANKINNRVPGGVFTLGVASGDPLPDGIVLWTRLAPRPTEGGGMPDHAVTVQWQVADDPLFRRLRCHGAAAARPELAHSVHVEVRGLSPDTVYYYRFRAGGQISRVGRTRTAPAAGAAPRNLRFAFASCQDWQSGYYSAYRHMAREDLDFVAFLGDYIYENARNPRTIRHYEGTGEPYTLYEYRNRHATHKTDPDLQAAHAAFGWIVTLDDHEVDNDWADMTPQDPDLQSRAAFRARRIAAFRAYYEHMPLRRASLPHGPDMQLYRRVRFGSLAEMHVLDTRQYRSDQPGNVRQANNPALTMTGATQERWLVHGLRSSPARWNLLANQVMWAENARTAGLRPKFDFDDWDGYVAQRTRLQRFLGSGYVRNPVILTGDRHSTFVCDLRPDFDDPSTPAVSAEITGTSITSGGDQDQAVFHEEYDPIMRESPHWRYIDNERGYVVCDVTPDTMVSSLRTVDTVWSADATIRTKARFVIEADRPGIAAVE